MGKFPHMLNYQWFSVHRVLPACSAPVLALPLWPSRAKSFTTPGPGGRPNGIPIDYRILMRILTIKNGMMEILIRYLMDINADKWEI